MNSAWRSSWRICWSLSAPDFRAQHCGGIGVGGGRSLILAREGGCRQRAWVWISAGVGGCWVHRRAKGDPVFSMERVFQPLA